MSRCVDRARTELFPVPPYSIGRGTEEQLPFPSVPKRSPEQKGTEGNRTTKGNLGADALRLFAPESAFDVAAPPALTPASLALDGAGHPSVTTSKAGLSATQRFGKPLFCVESSRFCLRLAAALSGRGCPASVEGGAS